MGTLLCCNRGFLEIGIDGKVFFLFQLNSNMFNSNFPFDGHVFLLKLVEMLSGYTYFQWISMIS